MKIDKKRKKILIVGAIIAILIFIISGLENSGRNHVSSVWSVGIQTVELINQKSELYENIRSEMENYPEAKETLAQVDKELEKANDMPKFKEFNAKDFNLTIDKYKGIDKAMDKLVELYDSSSKMNENGRLKNAIDEYTTNDTYMENTEKDFNKLYIVKYNKYVKNFPTNIIAKVKKLNLINEF